MIVVDSAIWIDHFHHRIDRLADLMALRAALLHPFALGELALGSLRGRDRILIAARDLPVPPIADSDEVLGLIQSASLSGTGIGYVDAHLLASALLAPNGKLWTRDKRLAAAATRLGVAFG